MVFIPSNSDKNKDLRKITLATNNQRGPIKICIRDLSQIRSLGIT